VTTRRTHWYTGNQLQLHKADVVVDNQLLVFYCMKFKKLRDNNPPCLRHDRMPWYRILVCEVRWKLRWKLSTTSDKSWRFQISAYHTEPFWTQVTSIEVGIASQISDRRLSCVVAVDSFESRTYAERTRVCPLSRFGLISGLDKKLSYRKETVRLHAITSSLAQLSQGKSTAG